MRSEILSNGFQRAADSLNLIARYRSVGRGLLLKSGDLFVRPERALFLRRRLAILARAIERLLQLCLEGVQPRFRFFRIDVALAQELLAILRSRLENDRDLELRIAAAEQAKITELRLQKLVKD